MNTHRFIGYSLCCCPRMLGCPPSQPATTRSLNMNPVANKKCSCKASKIHPGPLGVHPGPLLAPGLVLYTLEYAQLHDSYQEFTTLYNMSNGQKPSATLSCPHQPSSPFHNPTQRCAMGIKSRNVCKGRRAVRGLLSMDCWHPQ